MIKIYKLPENISTEFSQWINKNGVMIGQDILINGDNIIHDDFIDKCGEGREPTAKELQLYVKPSMDIKAEIESIKSTLAGLSKLK